MTRAFAAMAPDRGDVYRLLAAAFRAMYGEPVPSVAKAPGGKPYFPERPDIHFSLSHTSGCVMAALGDAPCGCDVERVRDVYPGVENRVCSPEELEALGFFRCWVLKESFYKLFGGGTADFRRVNFRLSGDGGVLTPDPSVRARLYEIDGCRAAVCCRGEPPSALELWREPLP